MELTISLLVGVVLMEAYAWLPRLSDIMCEFAVQQVRATERNRCREEWNTDLRALPNTLVRLLHAISYLRAASEMNHDYLKEQLRIH
jgi:hypothetical protein